MRGWGLGTRLWITAYPLPYPSFTHVDIQPPPVEDEESEDTGASASASAASGGSAELFTGVSIKVSTMHALPLLVN